MPVTMNPTRRPWTSTVRPTRLVPILTAGCAAVVALTSCVSPSATRTRVGGSPARPPVVSDAPHKLVAMGPDITVGYTGDSTTITVPAEAVAAQLSVRGGRGSNGGSTPLFAHEGYGAIVEGTLKVTPGQVLTVAAGGQGEAQDGGNRPGSGGWSWPGYTGGRGGSGKGWLTQDGAGGGGASVVLRDGSALVVAAGGGGESGNGGLGRASVPGGAGGSESGSNGDGDDGGYGGSPAHPSNNVNGGSATSIDNGGGGGGGGRYSGGGGKAGQGGGGGGSSWTSSVSVSDVTTNTGSQGNPGNGLVTITWQFIPKITTYAFSKRGTVSQQVLDSPGDSSETRVDTHSVTEDPDGRTEPQQRWNYFVGVRGVGTISNSKTGQCLQVDTSDGRIDQGTCGVDAPNQVWRLVQQTGGFALRIDLPQRTGIWNAGQYYLATKTDSLHTVDGTELTLLTSLRDPRANWLPLHVS